MLLSKSFKNEEALKLLYAIEELSEETIIRAEYDLLYQNYSKAKEWAFKQLKETSVELRSFPMFEDMKNTMWLLAEFRGTAGEWMEFRREGRTKVEVQIQIPEES